VWAYKKQREIYRRTNAFAGELAIGHPKFREGSKAALSDGPLVQGGFKSVEDRKAIPPIVYDAEDDAAIEDWIRSNLNTTWHSLGTCKMAPKDKGGVVDKSLNVYGTQGLKLAGRFWAAARRPGASANAVQICRLCPRTSAPTQTTRHLLWVRRRPSLLARSSGWTCSVGLLFTLFYDTSEYTWYRFRLPVCLTSRPP